MTFNPEKDVYLLNELNNSKSLIIDQKMVDKKEQNNKTNTIYMCCFTKKTEKYISRTVEFSKKQIKVPDDFFKNNKPLFTGVVYKDKYIQPIKELNPFYDEFKTNKRLFISTNPFDE